MNRLSGSTDSWEKLLNRLAKDFRQQDIMSLSKYKPFTLIFEEIVLRSDGDPRNQEMEIKRKVAQQVDSLPGNSFHREIMNCGVRNILTTNYDYNFEKSVEGQNERKNFRPERTYSVFRRRRVNSMNVWHIHGEAEVPGSIMLGHEQYAGSLQKLRSYIVGAREGTQKLTSPFTSGVTNFDQNDTVHSWADIFLRDSVYIIGLSLHYTEIELWWLLSYKERLRKVDKYRPGETHYYHFYRRRTSDEEEAKLSILKSMGVKVHRYSALPDYENAYDKALRDVNRAT